jgi:hypothetical protein
VHAHDGLNAGRTHDEGRSAINELRLARFRAPQSRRQAAALVRVYGFFGDFTGNRLALL